MFDVVADTWMETALSRSHNSKSHDSSKVRSCTLKPTNHQKGKLAFKSKFGLNSSNPFILALV